MGTQWLSTITRLLLTRFFTDSVEIDENHPITYCKIVGNLSGNRYKFLEEIPTFQLNLGIKIKIPESMMKEKFILTIDFTEQETKNFISNAKILHVDKSMLDFNEDIKSAEVNGYGTESELENVVYILKTLDLPLKIPFQDENKDEAYEYVANPNIPKNYNFMWLAPKLGKSLPNLKIKLNDELANNQLVCDFYRYIHHKRSY